MANRSKLMLAALVSGVALSAASLGEAPKHRIAPAPKRPPAKAVVSDPAEPPLKAEVSTGGPSKPVTAAGTTVKFDTPGSSPGTATLTFKGAAPMRFSLTLAKMPSYDLGELTLSSGSLSLAVGQVTGSPST